MLVSILRYHAITGDIDTLDELVSARIEDATDELEDRLERPLRQGVYTEALYPDRCGALHPHATPILAATGYVIDGNRLRSLTGWFPPFDPVGTRLSTISVTYTGGFVERTVNPSDPARLPSCMERDIAYAALTLGVTASPYPVGARSVTLGDASITFGPNGAPDLSAISWSRQTLRYAYRPVVAI